VGWYVDFSALLVSGAYKLADTVKKPPPITGDQAVKFANYFLSRRSVQTAKGAYSLLEVVNTLTNNKVLSVLYNRIYCTLLIFAVVQEKNCYWNKSFLQHMCM
jgi:hypothetical protein